MRHRISIEIRKDKHKLAKEFAKNNNKNFSLFINELIDNALLNENKKVSNIDQERLVETLLLTVNAKPEHPSYEKIKQSFNDGVGTYMNEKH